MLMNLSIFENSLMKLDGGFSLDNLASIEFLFRDSKIYWMCVGRSCSSNSSHSGIHNTENLMFRRVMEFLSDDIHSLLGCLRHVL
jgi:hypothetical protein